MTMREIKFRVWSPELVDYRTLSEISNNHGLGMGFEVTSGIGGSVTQIYRSVGDTPEQYTGIKDKNGVEIYENDIVRQQMRFTETNGVVFWQEEKARFAINLDGFITTITKPQEMSYEVVGNIHENPEKIKVVGDDCGVGD